MQVFSIHLAYQLMIIDLKLDLPRSTPPPSSSLPLRTLANFSLLRSVLTLLCLLIPSFLPKDFGVVDPTSCDGMLDKFEELDDDDTWVLARNGKTDAGFVVAVVGVEGAELDKWSEDSNCRGSGHQSCK